MNKIVLTRGPAAAMARLRAIIMGAYDNNTKLSVLTELSDDEPRELYGDAVLRRLTTTPNITLEHGR